MKLDKQSIITTFFPSIAMILVAAIVFTDIFGAQESLGLFIISLLLIFPALFFAQGMACSYGKGNIIVALLASLATFSLIVVLFMNSSALIYVLIYFGAALLGYHGRRLMRRGRYS